MFFRVTPDDARVYAVHRISAILRKTVSSTTDTYLATEVSDGEHIRRVSGAIEAGRKPGMPLSILSNIAREAPLGSLLIAFLLGVCRRPPPPAARAACSARWMDRQTETGEPHASGSCPAASRCRAVDEEKMM